MNISKNHWEQVYITKNANEVSWTQRIPNISLNFIRSLPISKDASIIDIGGGDSNLVDYLLQDGFTNITVLDIAAAAIEKSKKRLGKQAEKVKWIIGDMNDYTPTSNYDVWHDRATFHFLTEEAQIANYQNKVYKYVTAYLALATFSETGPKKCSGLTIKQYTKHQLAETFTKHFKPLELFNIDHITPFDTIQNFTIAHFKNKNND